MMVLIFDGFLGRTCRLHTEKAQALGIRTYNLPNLTVGEETALRTCSQQGGVGADESRAQKGELSPRAALEFPS